MGFVLGFHFRVIGLRFGFVLFRIWYLSRELLGRRDSSIIVLGLFRGFRC